MKTITRADWANALRTTPETMRTTGTLRTETDDGEVCYCALGVACLTAELPLDGIEGHSAYWWPESKNRLIKNAMIDMLGISADQEWAICRMNDATNHILYEHGYKHSWAEIADYIESLPPQ